MGLALWLVPPPAESSLLDSLISSLALTHSAPAFPAHVTLLTGIPDAPAEELLASVRTAVEEWKEMTARRRTIAREGREGVVMDQDRFGPSAKTTDASTSSPLPDSPDDHDDHSSPLPLLCFESLGSNANKYFQYLYIMIDTSFPFSGSSLLDLRHAVRSACIPTLSDTRDDFFPHLSLMYAHSGDGNAGRAEKIMKELQLTGDVVEDGAGCEVHRVRGFRPEEILFVRAEGKPEEWQVLGRVSLL